MWSSRRRRSGPGAIDLLADANVLLEAALEQDRDQEARSFLEKTDPGAIVVSDFGLYTVGIVLEREGKGGAYARLVRDITGSGGLRWLPGQELAAVPAEARALGLDFDDAYHHRLAEVLEVPLVSFDDDFDGTPRGRVRPWDAVESDAAS